MIAAVWGMSISCAIDHPRSGEEEIAWHYGAKEWAAKYRLQREILGARDQVSRHDGRHVGAESFVMIVVRRQRETAKTMLDPGKGG